jgi:hypothetical protein
LQHLPHFLVSSSAWRSPSMLSPKTPYTFALSENPSQC